MKHKTVRLDVVSDWKGNTDYSQGFSILEILLQKTLKRSEYPKEQIKLVFYAISLLIRHQYYVGATHLHMPRKISELF